MSDSAKYIRRYYGVPAFRGVRVTYQPTGEPKPRTATIVSCRQAYLRLRFDDDPKRIHWAHPTDGITYPEVPFKSSGPRGWCHWCTEDFALNADGTVRQHYWPDPDTPCRGAGQKPTHLVRHRTHPYLDEETAA